MKRKMVILAGLLLMGIVFFAPQGAFAQTWAFVSIDEVGASSAGGGVSNGIFTHISQNPVFTEKYFRFHADSEKQMLATVLTAVSLGRNVWIRIATDGSTVDRIRLVLSD